MGSIPELGGWKEPVHLLKWTEGHVWVSEKPIKVQNEFEYKYMVYNQNEEHSIWERGLNRTVKPSGAQIELMDWWEKINLTFVVNAPDEKILDLVILKDGEEDTIQM